jgi:hypothetical protein
MQGAGEFYFVTAAAVVVGGVSAAGAAVAGPAVGARELIRSWKKVGSQELAVREEALHEAFVEMASQQSFQDLLLTTVEQKFPHRLVAIAPNGQPKSPTPEVDAVFEARIDELRLERKGSDEGSYFLKIKARARLLRKEDGALIYQQSLEYRSGSSLFLDWTYHDALKGVTETGYRALSDYFADLIFNPRP